MSPSLPKRLLLVFATALFASVAVHADFVVSGSFLYVDRAFSFSGGFTGSEPQLPIRLATVQVIDNTTGTVLATGSTSQSGGISIPVVGNGTKNIVVRCFSRSNQFGAQSVRVVNESSVEYSVSSPVFSNWNLATNLDIATLVAPKISSGGSQGNPFNLLDQCVASLEYVLASGGTNPTQSVRMTWPGGSGSFASGTNANIATDDGYDDLVQLHEFGHVLHGVYSDSDNPGGSHFFGESDQDPRLSYGEGWASFFAGAVRQNQGLFDPGFYLDCSGSGATGAGSIQLSMRMETGSPYAGTTGGESDEGAVFCALWDLIDTAATNDGNATDDDGLNGSLQFTGGLDGDAMQWKTFIGPVKTAADLTIRNAWNACFAPVNYGNHAELDAIFNLWKIRMHNDDVEPNNTQATATPITPGTSWSATRTLYSSTAVPPAPGEGDLDHYSFSALSGSVIEVETRYPNGVADAETYCDTYLTLRRPNGTLFSQTNAGGANLNALLTNQLLDATGTWDAEVKTTHAYRKTGSYQLRVRVLSEPAAPPMLSSELPAAVPAVVLGNSVLTLIGQSLSGVTQVKVAGLDVGPPPAFLVVSSTQINVNLPLLAQLGSTDVTVFSPLGSASIAFELVANDPPLLELLTPFAPTLLTSVGGASQVSGGQPGDLVFYLVSPELLPSSLPGLFDLAIGNNLLSLVLLGSKAIDAKGYAQLDYPLIGVSPGLLLNFQAAVFRPSVGFPLIATNTQLGFVLF